MLTLKRINVLSAAKMAAILDAIIGIIMAIFIFILVSAFSSLLPRVGIGLFGIGAAILVVLPVLLFVLGFVVAAIESWLYNIISERFGGIKIDIKKNQLKSIDIISTGRIYAVGGAIVGFVAGVIFAIVGLSSGSTVFGTLGLVSVIAFPLLFALGFFVAVAVGVVLYNFIASKIGGVVLLIKKGELKSVDPLSYAKIESVFGGIVGFVEGLVHTVGSALGPAISTVPPFAHGLGALSIIAFPIFYFVLSFVVSFIVAWLYNFIAPRVGGIKIVLY